MKDLQLMKNEDKLFKEEVSLSKIVTLTLGTQKKEGRKIQWKNSNITSMELALPVKLNETFKVTKTCLKHLNMNLSTTSPSF